MNKITQGPFTVTITISRWFRFRVWLACKLLQYATHWMPKEVVVANPMPPMSAEQVRQLQDEILERRHTLQ